MPTIVFASPKGGAGKSTSAVVLATELAGQGATVAIVDAGAGRPRLAVSASAAASSPALSRSSGAWRSAATTASRFGRNGSPGPQRVRKAA